MPITQPTVTPRRSVDEHGRLLPMTEGEIRAHNQAAIRALEEIANITDETDTDEMYERFIQGLDEDRLSDRRRFR
jgi:hypothetical protein